MTKDELKLIITVLFTTLARVVGNHPLLAVALQALESMATSDVILKLILQALPAGKDEPKGFSSAEKESAPYRERRADLLPSLHRSRCVAFPQRPRRAAGGYDYAVAAIGATASVDVLAATSLGQQGIAVAQAILATAEADYQALKSLFGAISLPRATVIVAPLSAGSDGTGGAYHYGCAGTDLYCDADFLRPERTRALFIAELSEVGQAVQAQGWDCSASNGEGLSRFHAELAFPGALDDFETFSAWLDGGRPNWIDQAESTDRDPLGNGCSVGFLFWLLSQGYTAAQLTQAAATTLAGTYQRLGAQALIGAGTGTMAWTAFRAACDAHWPADRPSGVSTDNPWGAAPVPKPPPGQPAMGNTLSITEVLTPGTYEVSFTPA